MSTVYNGPNQGKMIILEEGFTQKIKSKGRRCCLGATFIQFLSLLAILHQDWLGEEDEFILVFISSWCKIAGVARNWIILSPQTAATTFAFSSVFIFLVWSRRWLTLLWRNQYYRHISSLIQGRALGLFHITEFDDVTIAKNWWIWSRFLN